jgi:hypothetical protein
MVDGFLNYKINRYKNRLVVALKKIKGDVVCDSDILGEDMLQP